MRHFIIHIIIIVLCSTTVALAQQEMQYTQFMYDKLNFNPAYAGAKGQGVVSAHARAQWVGFEGAPVSQTVRYHQRLFNRRVGLGVSLDNDMLGDARTTSIRAAYAYHIPLTKKLQFSLGLNASVGQYRIDYAGVRVDDPNDPRFGTDAISNRLLPNIGMGGMMYSEKFYVGISVPRVIANTLFDPDGNAINDPNAGTEVLHAYGMAGASFRLNRDLEFRPNIMMKYAQNSPISIDLNAMLNYRDMFGGGLTYRMGSSQSEFRNNSIDVLFNVNLAEQFTLGFSYDYNLSRLNNTSAGSYELMGQWIIGSTRNTGVPCYYF